MRCERELRQIINECEDFKKFYNDLVQYLDVSTITNYDGKIIRRSYNWWHEPNEVQVGLDNMAQILIEQCNIYKYREWKTAMFSYLKFLISETDDITADDVNERIDKTWRGHTFYFDAKKTRDEVTMEQYARLHFPWIVRLAMSDKSLFICLFYLFFALNFFINDYLFDDIWGTDYAYVIVFPIFSSLVYLIYFTYTFKHSFILLRLSLCFMLFCLLSANYLIIIESDTNFDYYKFINRFVTALLWILPVIPVDVAHICDYWRKSIQ